MNFREAAHLVQIFNPPKGKCWAVIDQNANLYYHVAEYAAHRRAQKIADAAPFTKAWVFYVGHLRKEG